MYFSQELLVKLNTIFFQEGGIAHSDRPVDSIHHGPQDRISVTDKSVDDGLVVVKCMHINQIHIKIVLHLVRLMTGLSLSLYTECLVLHPTIYKKRNSIK